MSNANDQEKEGKIGGTTWTLPSIKGPAKPFSGTPIRHHVGINHRPPSGVGLALIAMPPGGPPGPPIFVATDFPARGCLSPSANRSARISFCHLRSPESVGTFRVGSGAGELEMIAEFFPQIQDSTDHEGSHPRHRKLATLRPAPSNSSNKHPRVAMALVARPYFPSRSGTSASAVPRLTGYGLAPSNVI